MKLSIDCVKDILAAVENKAFGETFTISNLASQIHYSENQLEYTCLKLYEAGYLDITTVTVPRRTVPGIYSINELTYAGHEFLGTISSNKVLETTKKICYEIGISSLKGVSQVAVGVLDNLIKSFCIF